MAKKAVVSKNPALDPTLPNLELVLAGKTYHPFYSFGALALAERKLKQQGEDLNIFRCVNFDTMGANSFLVMLYAALITQSPDLTLEQVEHMVDITKIVDIKVVLFSAWILSLADKSKEAEQTSPLVKSE